MQGEVSDLILRERFADPEFQDCLKLQGSGVGLRV
jgi:hypothetical protein